MTDTPAARLDVLHRADFSDFSEFALRQMLVFVSAVIMTAVTGDVIFALWLGVYFTLQAIYWKLVTTRRTQVSLARLLAAYGMYVATLTCFAFAPFYAMMMPDPIYVFAGGYALMAVTLFITQRPDPGWDLVLLDSGLFAAGVLGTLLLLWPKIATTGEALVALVICGSVVVYFFRSNVTRYHRRVERLEAEQRYARALKARALGQFVGGVAHDFNNQLAAILGHLELFELLDTPQEREDALRQARESAERAAMTVKQLLASSGRTRLSPKPIDMTAFVTQLGPVVLGLTDGRISLQVAGHSERALIAKVDTDMLETCVLQLCLNAQDAMTGKGKITIRAELMLERPTLEPALEAKPPYVAVTVEDSGPGVSREALSKIAEPFYTTKAVGEGAGLGLSAVAGFARQSGGGLLLENGAKGLRASILLPLHDA